jgi:GNAT superfamily N-acetyltransferase
MRLLEIAKKENQDLLDDFAQKTIAKHGLKNLWLFDLGNNMIELSVLLVDKEKRKQGAGTGAMEDLADFADEHGFTVVLIPGVKDIGQGTTSRSRLVKFYKRFGFIENKGRNIDYAIGAGKMIRYPQ